VFTARYELGL